MNSADFIDMLRAKRELSSDNKVAKYMGMEQSHISSYRTGRREFSDATCAKFAEALELPATYVIAEIHAHRAKDSSVKIIWQNLAETIRKSHAFVIVVLIGLFGLAPNPAGAATDLTKSSLFNQSIHYAHFLGLTCREPLIPAFPT